MAGVYAALLHNPGVPGGPDVGIAGTVPGIVTGGDIPEPLVVAAHDRLTSNARRFDALLSEATGAGLSPPEIAARAERVARFGVRHHPGALAATELEHLVEQAGRRLTLTRTAARPRRVGSAPDVHRVLHVLTAARDAGGHTRLAWNWIRHDRGRRHDVVLLDQTGRLVPYQLAKHAYGSGGHVVDLTPLRTGYVRQVEALSERAATADVVVLHHHPHDPVPGLTFADPEDRPPIILVNHAGRVFATGFAVADVVAWLRPSTGDLLVTRRGMPPERTAFLPIPLTPPSSPRRAHAHRRATRARLGIPADAVVVVTMANAWKYRPIDDVALPACFADILARHPDAHVVAVGPAPDADWAPAIAATQGRIHAVGEHTDPTPYLDAADLAVDSHPVSSETAVRDVALAGLPVVSLARWRSAAPATAIDLPGPADDLLVRAATVEQLDAVVDDLLTDPAGRRGRGARLRDALAADGLGPGFVTALDALYDRVLASTPVTASELGAAHRELGAIDAYTVLTTSGPEGIPSVAQLLDAGEADPGRRRPRLVSTRPTPLRLRALVARLRHRVEARRSAPD